MKSQILLALLTIFGGIEVAQAQWIVKSWVLDTAKSAGTELIENEITDETQKSLPPYIQAGSMILGSLEVTHGHQINSLVTYINRPHPMYASLAKHRLNWTPKQIAKLPKIAPWYIRGLFGGFKYAMRANAVFGAGLVGWTVGEYINKLDKKYLNSYINIHVGNVIGPTIAEGDVIQSVKNASIPALVLIHQTSEKFGNQKKIYLVVPKEK